MTSQHAAGGSFRRAVATALLILGMTTATFAARWVLRIDIPGATSVGIIDVSSNRRFVIGAYCGQGGCANFLWHRGRLTTVSVPGAQDTYLEGVNDSGDLVGHTWSPDAGEVSFVRRRSGAIRRMNCRFATYYRAAAINDGRTVVGSWSNADGTAGAFRWRDGRCEKLPITLHDGYVFPNDISRNGIVVGMATPGELEPQYGFMVRRGHLSVVEHPEAPYADGGVTALIAVAPNGLAAGRWSRDVGGVIRGEIGWFLYRDGLFESVPVPGEPRETSLLNISSDGVITYARGNEIRAVRVSTGLTHY